MTPAIIAIAVAALILIAFVVGRKTKPKKRRQVHHDVTLSAHGEGRLFADTARRMGRSQEQTLKSLSHVKRKDNDEVAAGMRERFNEKGTRR